MIQAVERFIKRHNLIPPNQKVLIGVSGGPDSMALLHFLWSHKEMYFIDIIVAHVDHMFRGKQSEEDAQFVERYCKTNGITFEGTRINVREYINTTGKSSQVAARDCRYAFYKEIMDKHHANVLVLGHHGDDQIETMLMRLTNGLVDIGSLGIPYKRNFEKGVLVRPFLCITKREIEQYCKEKNIPFRIDPSNKKDVYTRNRFRSNVLPFLKQENNSVHVRFQQFYEILNEDAYFLNDLAIETLESIVTYEEQGGCSFNEQDFRLIPKPLQRRGIHLILNYLYQDGPIRVSSIHIEDCLQIIYSGDSFGEIHLPNNLRFVKSYSDCKFIYKDEQTNAPYDITFAIPSSIHTPIGEISCEIKSVFPEGEKGKDIFICNLEDIHLPLRVRSRKAGDRIMLKGKNGSKKIKDIFIDEKIPHFEREIWPIIEDAKGNIIWIPGIKHTRHSHVTENASNWVYLSFQSIEMH
jgi:tRNA(Ile)-lysidine synthase